MRSRACLSCGCQERLASGEDVFGPLIRQFLLDNKHRVTVEVRRALARARAAVAVLDGLATASVST